MSALTNRITVNAGIMTGKPTIRGLRITVEQILKALAAGVSTDDLLDDYPDLEPEDFPAVLGFAADLVSETQIYAVAV